MDNKNTDIKVTVEKLPESQFNKFYILDNMLLYRRLSNIQKDQGTLFFSLDRVFKKNSDGLGGPKDATANPRRNQ